MEIKVGDRVVVKQDIHLGKSVNFANFKIDIIEFGTIGTVKKILNKTLCNVEIETYMSKFVITIFIDMQNLCNYDDWASVYSYIMAPESRFKVGDLLILTENKVLGGFWCAKGNIFKVLSRKIMYESLVYVFMNQKTNQVIEVLLENVAVLKLLDNTNFEDLIGAESQSLVSVFSESVIFEDYEDEEDDEDDEVNWDLLECVHDGLIRETESFIKSVSEKCEVDRNALVFLGSVIAYKDMLGSLWSDEDEDSEDEDAKEVK